MSDRLDSLKALREDIEAASGKIIFAHDESDTRQNVITLHELLSDLCETLIAIEEGKAC